MRGRTDGNAVRMLGWVLCLCLCWSAVLMPASWGEGDRRGASIAAPDHLMGEQREESEKLPRKAEASRLREADDNVGAPARPVMVVMLWHLLAQWRAGLVLRLYGPGDGPWWEGLPDMGAVLARIQVLRC
ncbi:hypothetical protein SAMN04489712_10695 [Thermomonospora echinospora]|uniref:Uncharacterized protein n=1 Tax=Thermomonospora echinospora TaxID=1992 RepID=A0A1H6AYQ0_9ACTN|nr:hypothetical protein [Thermomonospora echinospora]SEG53484.1 hypothetical protein SAMN04489712_10695 [Thermomonospora echinospora]